MPLLTQVALEFSVYYWVVMTHGTPEMVMPSPSNWITSVGSSQPPGSTRGAEPSARLAGSREAPPDNFIHPTTKTGYCYLKGCPTMVTMVV